MDLLIERMKKYGSLSLATRHSGQLGGIGAWAERQAHERIVSVHFVNTSGFGIIVAPHGGSDRRLPPQRLQSTAPQSFWTWPLRLLPKENPNDAQQGRTPSQ